MLVGEPRIETAPEQHFVGVRLRMSFAANQTAALWQRLMPRRRLITAAGPDLYSIEIYPAGYFAAFDPTREYEKWAAVAVTDVSAVPDGLEPLTAPAGQYAVFRYRGTASESLAAFQHIFGVWLPQSSYVVDERPHLAVMGEQYRNGDPASEEDLWIPVRPR